MIRRYSPFVMLFDLGKLLRNSLVFVFYLYVLKTGSESSFIKYGRMVFLVVVGLMFFSTIYKWFTHKYKLDNQAFHLYKGLFNKSERTIPFSKIQNIHHRTSFIHRIFHLTSVRFETAMTDEDANIKFEVISQTEAERIEAHLKSADQEIEDQNHEFDDSEVEVKHPESNRTIHFQATKKDILKASFSSLSFLVLIPLIGSFYYKINEVFHVEGTAQGFFEKLISSWWIMTIIVIVLVIASATFGVVRTYLKYGKYEISSDSNLIYITRGVIDETAFSISKEKVQAIEITQSLMKRLLGLAEVKLTSAGNLRSEEDTLEVNTLYPFLPVNKAYKMVSEILPSYAITQEMIRLPKKSLWARLLRPSWLWIIATGVLYYFKPTILDVEQAWMVLSTILLICIVVSRWLNFNHTRYVINDQFIQFKEGALTTSLFVSKREKVIEVKVTRNLIQKMLGLASIGTINRGRPVHHSGVNDVPVELANTLFKWYMKRNNEIHVE
ncbi:PH domain-containing protein [Bacillus sp. SD088]|uniref:PH domain-containing protein n=1 Tax=Bacillus sp. SD088 TaxID=2782012 RepID=UPI001A95DA85|nr:PH domain-containing protein [Bacillus sp. SD088]MBO0993198.1 PH domain-containing protein [Bacillus sp. SD088]